MSTLCEGNWQYILSLGKHLVGRWFGDIYSHEIRAQMEGGSIGNKDKAWEVVGSKSWTEEKELVKETKMALFSIGILMINIFGYYRQTNVFHTCQIVWIHSRTQNAVSKWSRLFTCTLVHSTVTWTDHLRWLIFAWQSSAPDCWDLSWTLSKCPAILHVAFLYQVGIYLMMLGSTRKGMEAAKASWALVLKIPEHPLYCW